MDKRELYLLDTQLVATAIELFSPRNPDGSQILRWMEKIISLETEHHEKLYSTGFEILDKCISLFCEKIWESDVNYSVLLLSSLASALNENPPDFPLQRAFLAFLQSIKQTYDRMPTWVFDSDNQIPGFIILDEEVLFNIPHTYHPMVPPVTAYEFTSFSIKLNTRKNRKIYPIQTEKYTPTNLDDYPF